LEERMKGYNLPLMPVIWGSTCLIIGALVLIGLYGYGSAEKAMAKQFNAQQLTLAQQAASAMETFFADIREAAVFLSRSPEVKDQGAALTEQALRALQKSFHYNISFLFVQNRQGDIVSFYPQDPSKIIPGRDLAAFFEKARRLGKPIIEIDLPGEARPALPSSFVLLFTPIFRGPDFTGVLGCAIPFEELKERFITPIHFGTKGEAWLINQEGVFIAHLDPALQGKNAFAARRERDGDFSTEPIERIMREKMLRGNWGMD
jgi:two-component system, NtrC family, sensor histidine kinase HydH